MTWRDVRNWDCIAGPKRFGHSYFIHIYIYSACVITYLYIALYHSSLECQAFLAFTTVLKPRNRSFCRTSCGEPASVLSWCWHGLNLEIWKQYEAIWSNTSTLPDGALFLLRVCRHASTAQTISRKHGPTFCQSVSPRSTILFARSISLSSLECVRKLWSIQKPRICALTFARCFLNPSSFPDCSRLCSLTVKIPHGVRDGTWYYSCNDLAMLVGAQGRGSEQKPMTCCPSILLQVHHVMATVEL